jgi:hypothetical protein
MAPPSHKHQLERIQSELARSKRWRRDEGYDDLWHRMVDLYRGKHLNFLGAEDKMVVNVAFATKNIIAPSVAVNNPKFTVEPRKPETAPQAVHAQELLNYIWRSNKYKRPFRRAVDDFLICGHGFLKVGYKFVKEEVTFGGTGDYGDDGEGVADRDPQMPGNVESEVRVVDDRPFVERISPFDMFVDPDARNMEEIRWICQRVRRPVADVRVDERYNAKVRKNVSPTMRSRFDDEDSRGGTHGVDGTNVPGSADNGFVDVWEWYDVKRHTMCVFADSSVDGFLIAPRRMDYSFGHPFLMLRNYEVPDFFYPLGELEAMEPLQYELNETRTQMFNHRKRFARKWLYDEDAFDDKGLAALESDEDNTMVPVLPGHKLAESIAPMPAEGTPPEFYNQSDLIQSDIDNVTATSDYARGNLPEIRRTATEAAMIQDASNARAADKLALIEEFLSEVGMRIVQLCQQFMTGDLVYRVVGMTGMEQTWVVGDPSWIQGEFDFEVEGGSTQPRNESFRRQAVNQLVDAIAPFVGAGVIDMSQLAMHVLHEFGVRQPEKFIMQMAPPGMPGMPPGAPGAPPMDPGAMPPEQTVPAA